LRTTRQLANDRAREIRIAVEQLEVIASRQHEQRGGFEAHGARRIRHVVVHGDRADGLARPEQLEDHVTAFAVAHDLHLAGHDDRQVLGLVALVPHDVAARVVAQRREAEHVRLILRRQPAKHGHRAHGVHDPIRPNVLHVRLPG
jgi:hypothetical protein